MIQPHVYEECTVCPVMTNKETGKEAERENVPNCHLGTIQLGFIAALFTIARTWNQPKCPSTDEWIKKMRMDLESVIQSEVSQKEKNKYHMLTHIYGI